MTVGSYGEQIEVLSTLRRLPSGLLVALGALVALATLALGALQLRAGATPAAVVVVLLLLFGGSGSVLVALIYAAAAQAVRTGAQGTVPRGGAAGRSRDRRPSSARRE